MTIKNLSVFFPAYNEESNIKTTVLNAIKYLQAQNINFEIIVVDDGSKDKTVEVVQTLSQRYKQIKLIQHKSNRGYGGALKTGMSQSKYEWICYTDSDGQFDFSQLNLFLPYVDRYDLIIGYRKKRQDNVKRRFFAKLLRIGDFILFGVWYKDIDCGFKLFKKEVVAKVWPLVTESAITETEFIVRAKKANFKIKEIGVDHLPRLEGIQTGGQFKIILRAVKEALSLFWKINIK